MREGETTNKYKRCKSEQRREKKMLGSETEVETYFIFAVYQRRCRQPLHLLHYSFFLIHSILTGEVRVTKDEVALP